MEATAGYSRAVVDAGWVFVSGTTGYDYKTMVMPGSVEAQARNAIEAALAEAGAAIADVAHITCIVSDRDGAEPLLSVAGSRSREPLCYRGRASLPRDESGNPGRGS